jgi:glycosyltransferase involved in cell wall biosynthesis
MDMTLLEGRAGGSAVYARSLVDALAVRDDVDVEMISAGAGGGLKTVRWMLSGARRKLRATSASVLHSPAFLTPLNPGVPVVMTIHDLSLDSMPSGHPLEWRLYYRLMVPRVARRASALITHTETTKREVMAAFGVPSERVVAVPSGVDPRFFVLPPRDRSASPVEPLIVFPGPPIGRKNLDIVLRVLGAAPSGSVLARTRLEITGATRREFPAYERQVADRRLESRVSWLGRLPFEDLPNLYRRADLLVYPSFLEGFGFPPLEAMAAGTPVVAAAASCLPEVLGDGALLVDPHDDGQFAAALESVLTKPELRLKLAAAGVARARTFTWARSAEATVAVYKAALVAGESPPRAR